MSYQKHSQSSFKGQPFQRTTKAGIYKSNIDGWFKIVTPYNADFVSSLKTCIQPSHRKWDPTLKVWMIHELFLEETIRLLKLYYNKIETDLVSDEERKPINTFIPVFDILQDRDIDKLYKALAFAIHPDRGGTNELMLQLNSAYEARKNKNKV